MNLRVEQVLATHMEKCRFGAGGWQRIGPPRLNLRHFFSFCVEDGRFFPATPATAARRACWLARSLDLTIGPTVALLIELE